MTPSPSTYRWARPGDVNAFFGLMLDNMSDLVIFASILILGFGVPKEVVLFKMVPGSAVAVLVGDLLYTWMAFGLARRERRSDVTAMPLGMDTPSTIGYAVAIYGPAYMLFTREGMAPQAAGERLWYLSMAVMVMSGLIKAACSLAGERIRAAVPRAGLLGSIAAVALVLIAFLPSLKIFGSPIVGLLSLGIILAALIAHYRLPWNLPGALAAVGAGMLVYYALAALPFGLPGIEPFHGDFSLRFALPVPTLGFAQGLADAWLYFPIVLPFTLAIVVGSVDVTESAAAAGDTYPTRRIILADAAATTLAGLCGSRRPTSATPRTRRWAGARPTRSPRPCSSARAACSATSPSSWTSFPRPPSRPSWSSSASRSRRRPSRRRRTATRRPWRSASSPSWPTS
jgi:AGZA family xanthine/uracil permease-like MFS transporter